MNNDKSSGQSSLRRESGTARTAPPGMVLDFDGTITEHDIGDKVVQRFAEPGWEEGVRRLSRGEWSVGKLQQWEAQRLPADRLPEMEAFALQIARIRPGLRDLVDFARRNGIRVEVASAGFDFYVHAILKRGGFEDLDVVVPRVVFGDGSDTGRTPRLEYPPGLATCEQVGLCKCDRLWRMQREGRPAFFVGDGISDHCAADEADLVFARGSLLRYCRDRDIPHVEYEDFTHVLAEVKRRLAG